MDLREEQVEMRGAVYTVKEMSARDIIPIMDAMNAAREDGEEGPGVSPTEFSQRIFEASCYLDGERLVIDETPAAVYMRLMPIAMRLNGASAAGND